MVYLLPAGVLSASGLSFPSPVCPRKNPTHMPGRMISTGPSTPPVRGFRCKKWGAGQNGDKKAGWRKGRGLSHGMRSTKFVVAKTAKANA